MKKILLVLLLTIFFIPNVNAAEIDSCYDDYLVSYTWNDYRTKYDSSTNTWVVTSYSNSSQIETMQYLFPVLPNTTYYFKSFNGNIFGDSEINIWPNLSFYDNDKNYLSNSSVTATALSDQFYFTTPSSPSGYVYISMVVSQTYNTIGTTIAFADFDLSTCPIVETPEEPEEPEIVADTTLDNFYSIYLDKLGSLAQFATENKFVLSALVIVLVFVCLELFLYLCKGGRK